MMTISTKSLFSILWIFVLLNLLFHDLYGIYESNILNDEVINNVAGRFSLVEVAKARYLFGVIAIEIPIFMVVLSQALKYAINRLANIMAGVTTIFFIINCPEVAKNYDDIFFTIIEIISLLIITIIASTWSERRV